ncbi:MAG: diguanylate cyclase [Blastocatellia bacterium]|nr:diguanylate cyclase [Blastocatellia bacterium]
MHQVIGARSKLFMVGVSLAGVSAFVYSAYSLFIAPVRFDLVLFLISVIVPLLAYIIYKAYLKKVEASNEYIERLTRLHLATIESLTMAIDAKDEMSRGHIQRVRVLAEGLARAVGYPEDQMEGLKTAALLHDIGKLAVPEHILNKPGKLSKAEYSKIMNHPVVGADILSNVEFPYEVVPIVRHHHERFDGTGYPGRLKGEEIPLGARILTVVDCYDALITDRPHRPSYEREQALELMRAESGRTFDPAILEAFFKVIISIESQMPATGHPAFSAGEADPNLPTGSLFDEVAGRRPRSRTEEAMRDIAAAQREVLSLYEISQTLGSTLKLSEILPIVAAKLAHVANFTTLIIYLAKGNCLQAAHVIGHHAESLKNLSLLFEEGGAGWVASHRQVLIGGSPLADLERPLGHLAALYRSTAIFPLLNGDLVVGVLALYSEEDQGYSSDEVRLLETISSHAATAIYNALVFERTQESALTDGLTGLPNSRYLYSFFDQERSRAERYNYPLVLMMMDLDGFKKVNDTYGHHVGDDILRYISASLRAHLRTDDTLVRYAGDEFVAVLHRATADVVLDLKVRLQSALDDFAYEVRPGRTARAGISIGYATYGEDGTAIEELMEVADQRMYEDKAVRRRKASLLHLVNSQAKSIGL